MPTAEQLAAARAHGANTDLVEITARWLDNGRCCGRKPLSYKRPTPFMFCCRCGAHYDLAGNQIEDYGWKRTERGTFVSAYWPTAEKYREAVKDHGAPQPLRTFPSVPEERGKVRLYGSAALLAEKEEQS